MGVRAEALSMSLLDDYKRIRRTTLDAVAGLTAEDCLLQAMPDVSPPKWHLGHTTWFFEAFLLAELEGYSPFDAAFAYLFNSYYEAAGSRQPRDRRGVLSRPDLGRVLAYRAHVDDWMERAFGRFDAAALSRLVLGLHHEQQHQELLVMDVKYNFGESPLSPAHRPVPDSPRARAGGPLRFVSVEGGVRTIGHRDPRAFAYDNEGPSHERVVEPFRICARLVTNGEMLEFIRDGGYQNPALWLSDGIAWVRREEVRGPLYWRFEGDAPAFEMTTHGLMPWDPEAPVCHVSAYEAAAFAEWAGARLPTEFEWEVAAADSDPSRARWLEDGLEAGGSLHPGLGRAPSPSGEALDLFGELWAWTRSAYEPYPRYRPLPGALGEYNGKFMSSQWVLRGGCVATPRGHIRKTYRNFFYPMQRWPFTGIRLAKDGA